MGGLLVSFVIVNFNGRDHLDPLLASIIAQTVDPASFEVIVVDNGSQDGSVSHLRTAYPEVRIIENEDNRGFAAPNNQAARIAHGKYLALLNNDMRLEPTWLAAMLGYLSNQSSDMVCVGSKIVNWDGTLVDFIGGSLAFNGMGFQTNFQAPVDSIAGRAYPQELLFACGGAMLIDRAVFLDAGGFDEDYFAYFEDVDLGWRLWVLGYRIGFCPEAVACHRHNGTSSRFNLYKKMVLFERNSLYSVFKNYEAGTLAQFFPAALLLSVKRMAVRSAIDKASFKFTVPATPPVPPPSALTSSQMIRLFLRFMIERGPKQALKRSLLKLAEMVLRRWGPPLRSAGDEMMIRPESYSTVVAMEDFMDHLPRLQEKRQGIQAKRKRSDAELFALFGTPFKPVEGQADYPAVHDLVIDCLGVRERIESGLAAGTPSPNGSTRTAH